MKEGKKGGKEMKNKLPDLQNHLFEMIEKLNDDHLVGDDLTNEIRRCLAVNELAKTAVANGALMVKAADTLYGIPISEDVPLLPKVNDSETYFVDQGKKTLLAVPNGNRKEDYGFVKGKRQPV
jgi:hypothetical protein